VNRELLTELNEEIDKGNFEEVKSIARDIITNEGKINEHGRRADSIVKSMLQHSSVSSGTKEPTDINALADEYLRLAYHGQRAKDKGFNVTINKDFDPSVGNVNIVAQDFGRVFLNLFNNAFYAMQEKQKKEKFEPLIFVKTERQQDMLIITVGDNGGGIDEKSISKVFQPFFTTKPTGEGTGLGLSLSYDIIKAHGGQISINNSTEGASFVIRLPIT
jgi:signal transduction histidine kinase